MKPKSFKHKEEAIILVVPKFKGEVPKAASSKAKYCPYIKAPQLQGSKPIMLLKNPNWSLLQKSNSKAESQQQKRCPT